MERFRRIARAVFRGGIVFYLAWGILSTAWFLTADVVLSDLPLGPIDPDLLAVCSATFFSVTLGLIEFRRAFRSQTARESRERTFGDAGLR